MKDEILKSFLSTFVEQNGLQDIEEDEAFEKFVNYNIISKLYPREVEIEDLSTGGSDDLAIDGAAIIVNGNIVNSEEEINFLLQRNGTLDVTFALVQSKKSPKFKGEQVGNFIFWVKSLFDEVPSIPENDRVAKLREIKEVIYKNSIHFDQSPELKLFFVTTGEWKEPDQITGKVRRELAELDSRSLFKNQADIEFYDAERLKNTYRELSRKSVKEIPFVNHVALPDMPGDLNVRQSFLGSVSVTSYIDLITNSDGNLSKELFYDNVRDFQGGNKVNKEITETLQSSTNQALLPLLNNGITVIAKKVDKIGSKLKLTDFQIVNGCQSSSVLFESRKLLSADTNVVLKIIDTTDQEVINKIIRATNRQTEVKDEAFESLKPFHKDLEEYYKAKSTKIAPAIYYERRSKQYLGHPKIKSHQIITLASQIKSYVSTVLEQPQSTHRYFGEILESNKEKLFNTKSTFDKYYLSALIVNRLDEAAKNNKIPRQMKRFKYHIAFLTYSLLMNKRSNDFGVNEMIVTASKKDELRQFFDNSLVIIEDALKRTTVSRREAERSRGFTNELRTIVRSKNPIPEMPGQI